MKEDYKCSIRKFNIVRISVGNIFIRICMRYEYVKNIFSTYFSNKIFQNDNFS